MTDLFIPSDPNEQLTCSSGMDNHDQVLLEGVFGPSLTEKTAMEGDIELSGPLFLSDHIAGLIDMSDSRNLCAGLQCSKIAFEQEVGSDNWTLHQLSLYAKEDAAILWGSMEVARAHRLAVRLMAPVVGEATRGVANSFTVSAGDAAFFVTGALELSGSVASPHIIPARNATDIVFTRHPTLTNRWLMPGFDVVYTDTEDNEWVLAVTAPLWQ